MPIYSISEHGDALEKEATGFIRQKFSHYELVWQIYIGHKGNGMKADMPGYSDSGKRDRFSERTYTILESAYLIESIIQSGIFESANDNIKQHLEFNKSFITFFACLGRIKDNLERATALILGGTEAGKTKELLDSFYQTRNIVLHGSKIPFGLDDLNLIRIPLIFREPGKPGCIWDDKLYSWEDYDQFQDEYASETIENLFDELLKIVDIEFAHYYDYLVKHLKEKNTQLSFCVISDVPAFSPSGSTAVLISRNDANSSNR